LTYWIYFNVKTKKTAENEVFIKASRDFLHGAYASNACMKEKRQKKEVMKNGKSEMWRLRQTNVRSTTKKRNENLHLFKH